MFKFLPSRDLIFLLAEKIGQLLAVAVVNVVVLRELGPSTYGYLGAATAILAILLPLSNFGQVAIVRELSTVSSQEHGVGGFVRYGLALTTAGSVVGLVSAVVIGFAIPEKLTGGLLLVLSASFLARPFWGHDAWYRAQGLNYRAAVIRISGVYISGFGRLVVVLTSESLILLAVFVVIEHAVVAILFLVDYRKLRNGRRVSSVSQKIRREVLASSVPMLASSFAVIVYMRVDQPMLLLLSGSSDVGLYSAAANLSDAVSFLPTVLATLFMPIGFRLYKKSRRDFELNIGYIMGVTTALGYIILSVGWLTSEFLIQALYGSEYGGSVILLRILLCSTPFIFIGVIQSIWIVAASLQSLQLTYALTAAVLNIGLNILVMPSFGAIGAAWTTVLAHAVASFLGNLFFRRTRPIALVQFRALNPFYAFRCLFWFLTHGGRMTRGDNI